MIQIFKKIGGMDFYLINTKNGVLELYDFAETKVDVYNQHLWGSCVIAPPFGEVYYLDRIMSKPIGATDYIIISRQDGCIRHGVCPREYYTEMYNRRQLERLYDMLENRE